MVRPGVQKFPQNLQDNSKFSAPQYKMYSSGFDAWISALHESRMQRPKRASKLRYT
jgi:hypothetical protein